MTDMYVENQGGILSTAQVSSSQRPRQRRHSGRQDTDDDGIADGRDGRRRSTAVPTTRISTRQRTCIIPQDDDETASATNACRRPVACVDLFCFPPGFANNPVRTFWSEQARLALDSLASAQVVDMALGALAMKASEADRMTTRASRAGHRASGRHAARADDRRRGHRHTRPHRDTELSPVRRCARIAPKLRRRCCGSRRTRSGSTSQNHTLRRHRGSSRGAWASPTAQSENGVYTITLATQRAGRRTIRPRRRPSPAAPNDMTDATRSARRSRSRRRAAHGRDRQPRRQLLVA